MTLWQQIRYVLREVLSYGPDGIADVALHRVFGGKEAGRERYEVLRKRKLAKMMAPYLADPKVQKLAQDLANTQSLTLDEARDRLTRIR